MKRSRQNSDQFKWSYDRTRCDDVLSGYTWLLFYRDGRYYFINNNMEKTIPCTRAATAVRGLMRHIDAEEGLKK